MDKALDPLVVLATFGVEDAAGLEPVGGGADTAIWRLTWRGAALALRVFRPEQAGVARKEVVVMEAARAAGLPAPRIEAAGAWQGRPALLLQWMPGRPLLAALLEEPGRAPLYASAYAEAQAAIHGLAPPPALLGRPHAWLEAAGPLPPALRARLLECSGEPRLLHLDYHPLNVLVEEGPAGPRVSGVIDWANALAGDPRADLARTLTVLRLEPALPGALRPAAVAFERLWRRACAATAGPAPDLAPFLAWAGHAMSGELGGGGRHPPAALEPVRRCTAAWTRRALARA